MAANESIPGTRDPLVEELAEDITVAIREFTERHPDTPSGRIGRALRLVEWQAEGQWLHRLGWAVALLAALLSGVVAGLALR